MISGRIHMRHKQLGISLGGLMMGAVIFIALAMLGLKMAPSYIEYFAIKKAVVAVATEKRGASVADIRKTFDARATIDDISTVKGSDLEITKEANEVVVVAAYRKEIGLAGNVGLYIDFRAASKD
jgi:hypothetical protein